MGKGVITPLLHTAGKRFPGQQGPLAASPRTSPLLFSPIRLRKRTGEPAGCRLVAVYVVAAEAEAAATHSIASNFINCNLPRESTYQLDSSSCAKTPRRPFIADCRC